MQANPSTVTEDDWQYGNAAHTIVNVLDELPLERETAGYGQPKQIPSTVQRVLFGLLIASGLQLVIVLGVFIFTIGDEQTAGRNLIMAQAFGVGMIFAILALAARRWPLYAALAGVFVFFAANIVLAMVVPGTLWNGFLLKLLLLIVLLRTLLSALEGHARSSAPPTPPSSHSK